MSKELNDVCRATMLVSIVFLTSCGLSEKELCARKLALLEANTREAHANVVRQKGECRALAIEFAGDRQIVENCIDTLRFMIEIAQKTSESVSKRYLDDDIKKCLTPAPRFNGIPVSPRFNGIPVPDS